MFPLGGWSCSRWAYLFIMKQPIYDFVIDNEYLCIRFENSYWFPFDLFERFTINGNVNDGIFHLSKKSWVSDELLNKIVLFCKNKYPNVDFDHTLQYIKERREFLNNIFKKNG